MKYVIYQKINEKQGIVNRIIHNPYPEQYVTNGVFTDAALPVIEALPHNMNAVLMINLEDKTLYLDYQEVQSVEKTLENVQVQIETVSKALEEIILGGV